MLGNLGIQFDSLVSSLVQSRGHNWLVIYYNVVLTNFNETITIVLLRGSPFSRKYVSSYYHLYQTNCGICSVPFFFSKPKFKHNGFMWYSYSYTVNKY